MIFKTFGVYGKTKAHTELLMKNKFTDVLQAAADGMWVDEHIRRNKIGLNMVITIYTSFLGFYLREKYMK